MLLLLEEPRRLSTDIDIIVEPETDINSLITQAGKIFPFIDVTENVRKGANRIEKRHFRFHFRSPRTEKDINVLLDVVFERNPYRKVINMPIRVPLLLHEGEDLWVKVPDKNCILGDKLTAFAPHTTLRSGCRNLSPGSRYGIRISRAGYTNLRRAPGYHNELPVYYGARKYSAG